MDDLGPLPEPAGFRTRYRSEPGMIGHYPWTYADWSRRRHDRPECDYEDLFTADQVRAKVAEDRERCAKVCESVSNDLESAEEDAQAMSIGAQSCADQIRAGA